MISLDIRIGFRADVQHRADFLEQGVGLLGQIYNKLTRTWTSLFSYLMLGLVLIYMYRNLVTPATPDRGPDLIKVAGLARSFEPLIHYTETGTTQLTGLQQTSNAVWDVAEGVRKSSMTSGPIITSELDQISHSFKTLSVELTRFFASVNGDVDAILIVMDWAKRELSQLLIAGTPTSGTAEGRLASAMEKTILFAHKACGSMISKQLTGLFGRTPTQIQHDTVSRTFHEFLSVLEHSIEQELAHALAIFGLFESIDQQFVNLHRAAGRELDTQQANYDYDISTIWARAIGPNKDKVAKYEANKDLLGSVRARTIFNRNVMQEHTQRLMSLKANLDILRQRLVSPLVRAENSSLIGVKEQIKGIDGVYQYLSKVRDEQKERILAHRQLVGNPTGVPALGSGPEWDAGIERMSRALVGA